MVNFDQLLINFSYKNFLMLNIDFYIKELNILFSGDTLFKDTYGRTDLPTSDTKAMARSVGITLMELDDSTEVFPGHGSKTSIGHERKFNELTRDYVIKWALNDK